MSESQSPKRTDDIQGVIIHEYDGIEEADNELPRWWLAMFYLTTIFAFGYWFYYEGFKVRPGPAAELKAELEKVKANAASVADSDLEKLTQDASAQAAGKTLFLSTCAPCHDATGKGLIGPNLTDKFWIHGGSAADIHKTIDQGFVASGMPAWGAALGPVAVKNVTAYVLTLRNTNLPGKEAQGEEYKPR